MNVAFLYENLHAGGGERVSMTTMRIFSQMGINTCFFATKSVDTVFSPGDVAGLVRGLPNQKGVFSDENVQFLIKQIRENEIRVLFLAEMLFPCTIPPRLQQETGVILVQWDHSMPLWLLTAKRINAEHRSTKSILKWLEWVFIGKLKYIYTSWGTHKFYQFYRNRLAQVDRYIVLCDAYRDELSEQLKLTNEIHDRIRPMYNTIDLPEHVETDKAKRIIYMGRLYYTDKRVDRLIRIWQRVHRQLPDWELCIYGDGVERERLKRMIATLGLPRVTMAGYVSDTAAVYREAAVLCMTSSFEGYPMALLEAQSHGVVPVAFDCCSGIRSIIGEGSRAGVLIEPYNREAYADALVRLCRDEAYRAQLQQAALLKSRDYVHETNRARWQAFFADLGLADELS